MLTDKKGPPPLPCREEGGEVELGKREASPSYDRQDTISEQKLVVQSLIRKKEILNQGEGGGGHNLPVS